MPGAYVIDRPGYMFRPFYGLPRAPLHVVRVYLLRTNKYSKANELIKNIFLVLLNRAASNVRRFVKPGKTIYCPFGFLDLLYSLMELATGRPCNLVIRSRIDWGMFPVLNTNDTNASNCGTVKRMPFLRSNDSTKFSASETSCKKRRSAVSRVIVWPAYFWAVFVWPYPTVKTPRPGSGRGVGSKPSNPFITSLMYGDERTVKKLTPIYTNTLASGPIRPGLIPQHTTQTSPTDGVMCNNF